MNTKRKRPRKQPTYRKVHVPMQHRSVRDLKVMGTRTVGNERRTLATVKVLPNNVYQVQLLAQDLCRISLQNVKKAILKYAGKQHKTISLTVLRYGLTGEDSCLY